MIIESLLFHCLFLYFVIGVIVGLLSGLLGIGGGIIVTPALLFIFQHSLSVSPATIMRLATGTSLAVMILTTPSILSVHLNFEPKMKSIYRRLAAGALFGVVTGALLAAYVPVKILKILLALFLLSIIIHMLMGHNNRRIKRQLPPWLDNIAGFFIGLCSGLLGIGGGILVRPYLTAYQLGKIESTVIAAWCTFTLACVGTATCIYLGLHQQGLPAYALGYVYLPAMIAIALPGCFFALLGARLLYFISASKIKYIVMIMLFCTAVSLIYS